MSAHACQIFDERRVVGFNQLIQKCLLGPVPGICARTHSASDDVLADQ